MKKIVLLLATLLISLGVYAQTPKKITFKPTDVISGKTIQQHARTYDVQAYKETKTVYTSGMSETAFVNTILSNFPSQADNQLKTCVQPYYRYIYSLHVSNLTDAQVANQTTGVELAQLITNLHSYEIDHPGTLDGADGWNWKPILVFIKKLIEIILEIFF